MLAVGMKTAQPLTIDKNVKTRQKMGRLPELDTRPNPYFIS